MKSHLAAFLPSPIANRRERVEDDPIGVGDGYWYVWKEVGESSIGKVQQWHGNSAAVVRAWAFYRRYGRELERMSEHAVLNANYLRHRIMNPDSDTAARMHAMPLDGAPAEVVKHEFTLSMSALKDAVGVTGRGCGQEVARLRCHGPNSIFPYDCP